MYISLHPVQIQILEIKAEIRQRRDRLHPESGRLSVAVAGEDQEGIRIH